MGRRLRATLTIAVCTVLAVPAVAQEQTPQGQEQPASRSLFLAALAPVLGTVAEKLFNWVTGPSTPSSSLPTVSTTSLAVDGQYYAGLAYETYLVGLNGQLNRVDPLNYSFRTGDQFLVKYMPNMPGLVEVTNVNPQGKEFKLGSWSVAAGQQITLPMQGTFQFAGNTGDEVLKIALTPCTSGAPSRDIVVNASASVNYGGLLPACSAAQPARSRDIVVNTQGGTAFAVSALTPQEMQSQSVDTRVVTLRFRHGNGQSLLPQTQFGTAIATAINPQWQGGWLVSPQEASQPKARALVAAKSDPGGPRVVVRSPGAVKEVRPPVNIDVGFEPQAGSGIDLSSLKVTYLAIFDVDITDRLAPYLTPSGIRAEGADLPPGDHTIEIAVKDGAGRKSVERLNFKVLEQ